MDSERDSVTIRKINADLERRAEEARALFRNSLYNSPAAAREYIYRLRGVLKKEIHKATVFGKTKAPSDAEINLIIEQLESALDSGNESERHRILLEAFPAKRTRREMYDALQGSTSPEDAEFSKLSRKAFDELNGLKNCFLQENSGLIQTLANNYKNRGIEHDDLVQTVSIAFADAVDRSRVDPVTNLSGFAYALAERRIWNKLGIRRKQKDNQTGRSDSSVNRSREDNYRYSGVFLEEDKNESLDRTLHDGDLIQKIRSLLEIASSNTVRVAREIFGNLKITPLQADIVRLHLGLLRTDDECREIEKRYGSGIKVEPGRPYSFKKIADIRRKKSDTAQQEAYNIAIGRIPALLSSDYGQKAALLEERFAREKQERDELQEKRTERIGTTPPYLEKLVVDILIGLDVEDPLRTLVEMRKMGQVRINQLEENIQLRSACAFWLRDLKHVRECGGKVSLSEIALALGYGSHNSVIQAIRKYERYVAEATKESP